MLNGMALEKIRGIVICMTRHSDRYDVVTLYTRERGRMAFLVPAGKSKSASLRRAMLMPMSVISAEIRVGTGRDLQLLPSPQRDVVWHDVYFSPVKSALTLFISDFLNAYLRYPDPEPLLWDFVCSAMQALDSARGSVANFHIAFLVRFLTFAGIEPDMAGYGAGRWFDMQSGCFSSYPPLHRDSVTPDEARHLPRISRISLSNYHRFRFTGDQRRRLLALLIRYYRLHFPGMSALKSPEVLSEVFS